MISRRALSQFLLACNSESTTPVSLTNRFISPRSISPGTFSITPIHGSLIKNSLTEHGGYYISHIILTSDVVSLGRSPARQKEFKCRPCGSWQASRPHNRFNHQNKGLLEILTDIPTRHSMIVHAIKRHSQHYGLAKFQDVRHHST